MPATRFMVRRLHLTSSSPDSAGLLLPAVLAARFMVGFGEGVALPSMNNLVARNIPPARRATALGTIFGGFHSGECEVHLRQYPECQVTW